MNETLNLLVGAEAILRDRIDRWFHSDENDGSGNLLTSELPFNDAETVALRFAEIQVLTALPTKNSQLSDEANYIKTVIDHTPLCGIVQLTFKCSEEDGTIATYDGYATKVDTSQWNGTFSNTLLRKVITKEFNTDDLICGSSYEIALPEECKKGPGLSTAISSRRLQRSNLQAKKEMEAAAVQKIILKCEAEDDMLYDEFVTKYGLINLAREAFKEILRTARKPVKGIIEVENPKGITEEVSVCYRRDDLRDISAVDIQCLEAMKSIAANPNTTRLPTVRKQGRKTVPSKTGSNTLDGLYHLHKKEKEAKKEEKGKALAKLITQKERTEKNLLHFNTSVSTKENYWIIDDKTSTAVCDSFLKVFFPDCGLLSKAVVGDKRAFLQNKIKDGGHIIFTKEGLEEAVRRKETELSRIQEEIVRIQDEIGGDTSSMDDDYDE